MQKSFTSLVVLLIIFGAIYTFTPFGKKVGKDESKDNVPVSQTYLKISGKNVCLPHKDTSGPQTMECAFGMQGDNGLYYALDLNKISESSQNLNMEDRMTFEGTFTPIEFLSSDHLRIYNIVGVLSVSNMVKADVASSSMNTLPTKYITATEWPPVIKMRDDTFKCDDKATGVEQIGKTENKTINGKQYCVTTESEGAAGSIYSTYIYATVAQSKTYTATFTLRAVQCGNYDEPQKSACEKERASFNVDTLADKIIQDAMKPVQM